MEDKTPIRADHAKEIKIVIPKEGSARDIEYGVYVDGIYVPVTNIEFVMNAGGFDFVKLTISRFRTIIETV